MWLGHSSNSVSKVEWFDRARGVTTSVVWPSFCDFTVYEKKKKTATRILNFQEHSTPYPIIKFWKVI